MRPSSTFAFGMQAFGTGVRVESDNEAMRDALNRFLLPTLPRCGVLPEEAGIVIAVTSVSGGFESFVNGRKISKANTLENGALLTVKALDDALIQKLNHLRAVHAGAVVVNGKALVIPGSSHAGKSSLVAELLRRGATHLSDEYALVDARGRVHAYPRPLLLRNGSPRQRLVLPQDLDADFASQPVTVGWIIGVDYKPEGSWNVQPISQSEAVMLLLCNTPHELEECPEMIDSFTSCAANASCYAGIRGDVVDAADKIQHLVSSN